LIRIPGDPEMESRVRQTAAKSFSVKSKESSDYLELCQKTLLSGSRELKASEKLKFHFLQRAFEGKNVPGLRRFVAAGRLVLSTFRRLRGNA
jgi:hypothetical protein